MADGTIKEEAKGLGNRISGDVKEATGAVVGNESLRREGEAQADYGIEKQANNSVLGSNTSSTTSSTTGSNRMMTGMFRDRDSAEKAYGSLASRGYSKDDVNLLMSDKTRDTYFADGADTELGSKAMEGAGVGSAIGGTLGAIIAGIAAIGTSVLLPGVGLIVAGPLAAALAGAGAGGLTGGLIGALVGSGIPEENAKRYQEGLQNGGIVMGVKPRSDEDASYFEQEWRSNNGQDIYRS